MITVGRKGESPEAKAHRLAHQKEHNGLPEVKEKQKAWHHERYKNPELKKRQVENHRRTQRAFKLLLIEYKGGKCSRCGLIATEDNACAFDFHHLDLVANDVNDRIKFQIVNTAYEEADKCILLCAVCHRMIHRRE